MTDKPTSKNSDNVKVSAEKANTATKSTQSKPTQTPIDKSSSTPSATKVSVNMADRTHTINSQVVDKSKQNKTVEDNNSAKQPKSNNKTSSQPSSPQKAKKNMKSESEVNQVPKQKSTVSKLAILSLIIALISVAGVVAIYFWHVQQQASMTLQLQKIKQVTAQENALAQQKMMNTLQAQEQKLAMQFSESANNMKVDTENNIEQLNTMVEKFSQNQPTDWLIHEAEYLTRVAARTLWLEKDTSAAIGLLQDADARIAELNDPEILPIRQLIYQDIEALKLIPKLDTEHAILSLMALAEQVHALPLATMVVPQEMANKDRFTLSDDISDWRDNIAKTWDRFLHTFVVVHNRVGELTPILPADQRDNLKENLSLKLQVAQWAASKGKQALFIKSLNDAQAWLAQYFDVNDTKNAAFIASIESIKSKVIVVDGEQKLLSLKAMRKILADKKSVVAPVTSIDTHTQPTEEPTKAVTNPVPNETSEIVPEVIEKNKAEQSTIEQSIIEQSTIEKPTIQKKATDNINTEQPTETINEAEQTTDKAAEISEAA